MLTPYYDTIKLDFNDGLNTLQLTYRDTLLYTERNDQKTTGLDALGVRPAQQSDPPLPIAPSNGHLTIDAEGIALNSDGTCVPFKTWSRFCSHCSVDSGQAMNMVPTSIS